MAALQIELVPCLKDNYAYLVHDADAGLTAIVDPSEPEPVREALNKRGWRLTHILNTHHHFDHTGGNIPLKEASGARVVSGSAISFDRLDHIIAGVPSNSRPHPIANSVSPVNATASSGKWNTMWPAVWPGVSITRAT